MSKNLIQLLHKPAQCVFMSDQTRLPRMSLIAAVVDCRTPTGVSLQMFEPFIRNSVFSYSPCISSLSFQSLLDHLWYIMQCKCYANSYYAVLFREQ